MAGCLASIPPGPGLLVAPPLPGRLGVAVVVGQLQGDALPKGVEKAHQVGQGAGGARMAERSVLAASSKLRISSCSVSVSRWG
jgi:hypothetical protein